MDYVIYDRPAEPVSYSQKDRTPPKYINSAYYWLEVLPRGAKCFQRSTPRIPVNSKCPCKSGKKYKRCCQPRG